jgi:hypothetical protein
MRTLEDYFAFDLFPIWTERDGYIEVELIAPPREEFYTDPHLGQGLKWWGEGATVQTIPSLVRSVHGVGLAMNDAWTVASWSEWFASLSPQERHRPITVLHADDHQDLMSPRLFKGGTGLIDAITMQGVRLDQPESVRRAIKSGAIGMGSFFALLVHDAPEVHVRHLFAEPPDLDEQPLAIRFAADTLLDPDAHRLEIGLPAGSGQSTYSRHHDPMTWAAAPEGHHVLLHIDMDYFNNRYDGDSDWMSRDRIHNPSPSKVRGLIADILNALNSSLGMEQIDDIFIGISPGFFPADLWASSLECLLNGLKKGSSHG